jgi:hypothetical protein
VRAIPFLEFASCHRALAPRFGLCEPFSASWSLGVKSRSVRTASRQTRREAGVGWAWAARATAEASVRRLARGPLLRRVQSSTPACVALSSPSMIREISSWSPASTDMLACPWPNHEQRGCPRRMMHNEVANKGRRRKAVQSGQRCGSCPRRLHFSWQFSASKFEDSNTEQAGKNDCHTTAVDFDSHHTCLTGNLNLREIKQTSPAAKRKWRAGLD